MDLKRTVIVGAAGLMAVGGIGAGVAATQTSPTPSRHTTDTSAEPTGPDTDTLQHGDQVGPDTNDEAGPVRADSETGSARDPEPNHQDANGAPVDHTPRGERPEAADHTD